MVNKGILLEKLTNKFNSLTLHSIVNECFINGLPLNRDEITRGEKVALTKYSVKVLESIDAFHALEQALENPTLTNPQRVLLLDIHTACTEASKEASNRIVKETNCSDPKTCMSDVVDNATFTESEYNKFMSKASDMNLDKISGIIKEKTLNVIKDEQEQYEKEEELENELKDALADSKDFSDATTESYMDIVLTKSDPRKHVTVFSKLQEAAMEMMRDIPMSSEIDDVIKVVEKVTFSSFVDDFKHTSVSFEIGNESFAGVSANNSVGESEKPKMALLVSIIVYTVMETLKTMNIYCPSKDCIKKFVSARIDGEKIANINNDEVLARATEMIKSSNATDFSKVNSFQLSSKLVELKKVQETLESFVTNNTIPDKNNEIYNVLSAIESNTMKIESILNQRNTEERAKATESSTYYDKLNHENDIAQFNKINRLYGKNPLVTEIHLKINPATESVVDVEAINGLGQVMKRSFMNIQTAVESSKYIEYLNDMYRESELEKSEKNVFILPNDGSGQKIQL